MTLMYSDLEAEQNFSSLLEKVLQEGEIQIKRQDGQVFVLRVAPKLDSPLNVAGLDLNLSADEIVGFVHDGRKQY